MRQHIKDWAANLGLLACAISLGGLLCELLIRLTVKDRILLYPRYHTAASYGEYRLRRLRPNSTFWHTSVDGSWRFLTNGQGFRDTRDYTYTKRPGLYRVICLGDSQTEGFECRQDHTYPAVLEHFLRREGLDAQVMNMGISGFGTAEELAFLENEGLKYQPDAVILGLFANDFEDNVKSALYGLQDHRLTVRSKVHTPGVSALDLLNALPPLRWLSENSYAYSLVMNTAWDTAKLAVRSREEAKLKREFAVATESVSDYEQMLTTCLVERMCHVCREHRIALIILDIPAVLGQGFVSSIPAGMVAALRANSDSLLLSEGVFSEYQTLAELHLPHGQHHISEFTHLMLGLRAGREILRARTSVQAESVRARRGEAR
jgi:hypothetical protein